MCSQVWKTCYTAIVSVGRFETSVLSRENSLLQQYTGYSSIEKCELKLSAKVFLVTGSTAIVPSVKIDSRFHTSPPSFLSVQATSLTAMPVAGSHLRHEYQSILTSSIADSKLSSHVQPTLFNCLHI